MTTGSTVLATLVAVVHLVACAPQSGGTEDAGSSTGTSTGAALTSTDATESGPDTGICQGERATSTGGLDSDGTTGPGPDGLCPGHAQVDACCCFPETLVGPDLEPVCAHHYPCQEIVLECAIFASYCPTGDLVTDCVEPIDCALAFLTTGQPGTLRWNIHLSLGAEIVKLHVVGDGTAFVVRDYSYDPGCAPDPVTHKSLRPAAFFTECMAQQSVLERFACLRDATLTGATIETCTSTPACASS